MSSLRGNVSEGETHNLPTRLEYFPKGEYVRWILGLGLAATLAIVWPRSPAHVPGPVLTAFQASKAQVVGFSVNDWVGLPPGILVRTELVHMARALDARSGCRAGERVSVSSASVSWVASCVTRGTSLRLTVEWVSGRGRYLVVDETRTGGIGHLTVDAVRAVHILAPFGPVHQSLTIEGSLRGFLSPRQERAALSRMLTAVGAREVNGERAREWVSIAAYTPGMGGVLRTQGQPVDLQLALVTDHVSGRTLVLVGSPLIAIPY